MSVTPARAHKILTGSHTFSQLGFSMLITRLKGVYSRNPSQATLNACADEINTFMKKFGTIMANDFAIISKL